MSIPYTYSQTRDRAALTAVHEFYMSLCAPVAPGDSALRLIPLECAEIDSWSAGPGRYIVTAWDGTRPAGVALGAEGLERECGYLTFLCVHPAYRRRGIGNELVARLEHIFAAVPGIRRAEAIFHAPVHLPWYIPGANGDWHPCLPGVDTLSPLYSLLRRRGWTDLVVQNAYHQRLAGYTDPSALAVRRATLLSEGIELTLYDSDRHRGLAELFENIRNPGWAAEVLAHTDRPIVVAVDHGANELIVSYTGPLSVSGQPSRGNFCGIGTRTDYRGRGIGKLVFCEMCRRHAEGGADFMSLYTGENNPARHIYEAAGFQVVRRFADMRKEL